MFRIALAQINSTVGALEANRDKIIETIFSAHRHGADLVAFPEMALTGYPPEDLLFKEHFIARNEQVLREVARHAKGIIAVVGFVKKSKGALYNAAAVLGQGKVVDIYYKQYLPNYSVFDEKRYFSQGNRSPVYRIGEAILGVTICEDIWVDDGPFLRQAKEGAGLIINISSSPYEAGKRQERLKLLKRRAKEAKAIVAYVNLVGGQDELVFDGASMIISPEGKLLASGAQFKEDLLVMDIDIPKKKARKVVNLPAKPLVSAVKKELVVQLPEPLNPVEEIYQAVVLGTRDYVRKNGFKKVVIGLSGGIDSALVAAIACDALGKENVVGISMPTRYNLEATKDDARSLAQNLEIEFHEIPIEKIFEVYLEILQPKFKGSSSGLAEENLQSRIRGNMLMAFSNKFGWLVLTTGNKSEMATGYCTLYGDMSGGYAVIKDILKTKVYALAEFYNQKSGKDMIPRTIFTRAPSAELRPNQTDQDSLPPYPILDALLVDYVEKHEAFPKMARKTKDTNLTKKVIELVDKSEYKRRQAPPGVKITRRAFGKDWRLPLTNQYKAF